jgi:hypothetical protein
MRIWVYAVLDDMATIGQFKSVRVHFLKQVFTVNPHFHPRAAGPNIIGIGPLPR